MKVNGRRIETIAIHTGGEPDSATGAVMPPIHLSTTFERSTEGDYPGGYSYTRSGNPNRTALERALTAIEGGTAAAAFSSGSAAASAVLRSALKPGDHLVVPEDMYHGVRKLIAHAIGGWGVRVSHVDMSTPGALAGAVGDDTRLVWVETPSNPLLKITDLLETTQIAGEVGARVVCDVTLSPAGMLPAFDLGAHLVVHSTTKYLSGHSDVLGGVVISRDPDDLFEQIRLLQSAEGAVPSPFDCWLALRGIKTLPYRLRGHLENAAKLASFLDAHSKVDRVYYPGLQTHHGHDVARSQMQGFGAMISFRVSGGEDAAFKVAARVQLITRATSLGGVESLIEHRASIEGSGSNTPRDLLRLSVGLEHPDDLIEDLDQALAGLR